MIRLFDIIFSSIAIIFFSPVFIIVMPILKMTGEHEIFYLQKRMGKNEKEFNIYKFATMLKNSVNLPGGAVTKRGDSRVLPVGIVLRKTKINELPQLINIWLGHMSIIGPRPLTPKQYFLYSEKQRSIISKLTPGLSGIGSIIFRDEERIMHESGLDYNYMHDEIIGPYKGELECWYYSNKSLFLYFKLIFMTVLAVLIPDKNYREKFINLPEPEGMLKDYI